MDDVLGIQTHAVSFVLQTLVEQAVPILERLLLFTRANDSRGGESFS